MDRGIVRDWLYQLKALLGFILESWMSWWGYGRASLDLPKAWGPWEVTPHWELAVSFPCTVWGTAQEGVPSFGGFSGSPEKEEKGRNVAQDWREQCTTACALGKAELCEIKSHCHAGH